MATICQDPTRVTRALVLFSGGLDSTTTLHLARSAGFDPVALIFRYGQRHEVEVERALALARELGVEYRLQDIDLRDAGGSALTSDAIDVPMGRADDAIADGPVPPTYVPARNTVFLSLALAWAEVLEIAEIFIGVNALDYSGYPDCRPEFIAAFEALANVACRSTTEGGQRVRIRAPVIDKTKAEIIRTGLDLGVDYSRTWSCYAPRPAGDDFVACGQCDSCALRRRGFETVGVPDPTRYAGSDAQ